MHKALKVLQVNASYKPAYIYGGPTMSVSRLSEELKRAGCQVEVITTTANGPTDLAVKNGWQELVDHVPVTYFKRITGDHTHFSPSLLRYLWKNARRYDLVHIHAWWNLVSVLACCAAIHRGVPVIVSPRGTLSPYSHETGNARLKKWLQRLIGLDLLMRCGIHVTSGREESAISEALRPRRIFNIPNFVKMGRTGLSDKGPAQAELRLLFLSRIEQKKGLEILLQALSLTLIPYRLTIAGDGEPDYVRRLKRQSEIVGRSSNIEWIGFQGSGKFDLIARHDLLVLPSYDENFGNVVIESLSVGTAVLISRNVGLEDYVRRNALGWVCGNTGQEIAACLDFIHENRKELDRIRSMAPEQTKRDFDPDTLVNRYLEMYHQMIVHD